MENIEKRLVEVDAILSLLSIENYKKIPMEIISFIKENKSKDYEWNYDIEKDFSMQNLNIDTISILSYINYEYLLNQEQKKVMDKILLENEIKAEKEKEEKYPSQNIFNKTKKNAEKIEENNENTLINKKDFSLWTRVKNILLRILHLSK